jgi:hypothetical protein
VEVFVRFIRLLAHRVLHAIDARRRRIDSSSPYGED